ncbi:COP9 signalosome subunit 7 [Colletotrichum tofieldiae]|uniref:COP9 signalosome subunit 7 (PCI domain-containing protein) n=1 Tax=Colletotrichum tofieldiae TaxID=708197 RepID=A0A166VYI8_9PEZI|nr:COP9 signalosome subunit 7 (PCI domain-containing protein) [Colletotrichum tofieldiae]GKT64779.1 COP9 signalosome subunit 7 [Colletotrichum tofieldiae]GKT74754.1 COP9 signalosome subunit 7 [Colletotrichum tofieldiae]GKT91945.1 COP9 signalosome subunit 7 [Colletotrichum tofieldiae]
MEQTKALNALEPFLALSKSATSPRAAADLITRATSNPNTFLFTELLETPQIQALSQSPDFLPHLRLLEIFSHGTYAAFLSSGQQLPQLNDAQTLKLRQLSLLTLARDRSNLSYAALQSALGLPSARALEDLVISAIYAGLLDATLDPHRQVVQVNSLAALRDLAPGAVPPMIRALHAWSSRCESTLEGLESQIAGIREAAARRQRDKAEQEARLAKLVEDVRKDPEAGAGRKLAVGHGGGGERGSGFLGHTSRAQRYNKRGSTSMMDNTEEIDDEAMDVDEEDPEQEKKRASRRKL